MKFDELSTEQQTELMNGLADQIFEAAGPRFVLIIFSEAGQAHYLSPLDILGVAGAIRDVSREIQNKIAETN